MKAEETGTAKPRRLVVRAIGQATAILAVAVVLAFLTKMLHPRSPSWFLVEDLSESRYRQSIAELRARYPLEGQIFWIDARPVEQFEAGHLEGARSLTVEDWADQLWDLREELQAPGERAVVVYCDGERCKRSAEVAQRLRELLALDPVWVLEGDWREW